MVEHEAGEEQNTQLFSTEESVPRIVEILHLTKILKSRVYQALADCNRERIVGCIVCFSSTLVTIVCCIAIGSTW